MRRRLQAERQHLGIGRGGVVPAERLDAGLDELRRRIAAMAKHRRRDSRSRAPRRRGRGEVIARHRNGQVRPQAQLAPVRIGGEEHAAADVLARQVEERLGRLQDRGRNARVSRALVMRDERLRPRVGRGHDRTIRRLLRMARRRNSVFRLARGFSTLTLRFRSRSPGALNAHTIRSNKDNKISELNAAPQEPIASLTAGASVGGVVSACTVTSTSMPR